MQGYYGNVLTTATPPCFLSMMGGLRGIPQPNPFLQATSATVFPLATATSPNHYEELVSRQRMVQSQPGIFGGFPPVSILSNQLPRFPWGSLSSTSGNPAISFGFEKKFGPRGLPVRITEKNSRESPKNKTLSPEYLTPRTSNSSEKSKSHSLDEKKTAHFDLPTQQSTLNPDGSFPRNFNPFYMNNRQLPVHVNSCLNPFLPSFCRPRWILLFELLWIIFKSMHMSSWEHYWNFLMLTQLLKNKL